MTEKSRKGGKKGRMLTFEEMKDRAAEKERTMAAQRRAASRRSAARGGDISSSKGAGKAASGALVGKDPHLAAGMTTVLTPREEVAQLRERWANGDNWLPVTSVAKRMGISRRRVYTLIQEGRIPAVNFGERLWRVRERDLLHYMEHCGRRSLEERGHDLGITGGRADRIRRKEDITFDP